MTEPNFSPAVAPQAGALPGALPGAIDPLHALLGDEARQPWWRRNALLLGAGLLLACGAGLAWWLLGGGRAADRLQPQYVTTPISRGAVQLTVSANGTLAPTRSVSIGSELSGTVTQVLVDVNDSVRKGQILVQLDTAKLRDQITRSRATLASAQAKLASANATVAEARSALDRLEEARRLSAGRVPAAADLSSAQATLAKAQAEVLAAQAAVADARAALSTDETNLSKAAIRSPIDGVVLTRAVEPGNAVAASLQAVTLFTLAPDLRQLLLNVNVDEADVGAVALGQRASFTVAAYAGRNFPARITRVAYGSTISDNVVTYTTQMAVDNPDLQLRPGMTANATITATEHADVLRVPLSALRFKPAATAAAGAASGAAPGGAGGGGSGGSSGSMLSKLMPRPPGASTTSHRGSAEAAGSGSPAGGGHTRTLWVLKNGQPEALPVTIGLSDGRLVEVSGAGLAEGLPVITDQRSSAAR